MIRLFKNRKLRLGLVLGIAVLSLYAAWRTGPGADQPKKAPCVPGRHVETDASGKVVEITNRICRE